MVGVGDNVRWHRPPAIPGVSVAAFLVDGSVGVVKVVVPGDYSVTVEFESYGFLNVDSRDLTLFCPANLTQPEEVEAWLSS